jgi:DMSO reductase anchor subunit
MEIQIPLVLFVAFCAVSAGIFGTQAILALKGEAKEIQVPTLIASVVALAIGGISVLFHLAQPLHIFNGFGNLTSGITQELIVIVILAVVMLLYFIFLRRNENVVPKWCAVLALVVCVVLDIICAHSYMMSAKPAWNNVLQILSVFGASLSVGPAVVAVIAGATHNEKGMLGVCMKVGSIAALVVTVAFIAFMATSTSSYAGFGTTYIDPVDPTAHMFDASTMTPFGAAYLPTTLVAIVLALATAVFGWLYAKSETHSMAFAIAAAICGLLTAIVLRVLFYQLGANLFNFYGITG